MPKRTNITGDAARIARAAAGDLRYLQSALRAAEDNLAGLHRMLKVPNTTGGRRMIKGSTSTQPLLYTLLGQGVGSFLAYDIRSGGGATASGSDYFSSSSFYRSSVQLSETLYRGLMRGQRIL